MIGYCCACYHCTNLLGGTVDVHGVNGHVDGTHIQENL